jgi:multiple sugar transport system permease protein
MASAGDQALPRGRPAAQQRTWWSRLRRTDLGVALIFLLPNLLGFLIFTARAVIEAFRLSFYRADLLTPEVWIGLDNYRRLLFTDDLFRKILFNTVYYTLGSVPLAIVAGLLLAVLVNAPLRGMTLFRTAFFMPVVSSVVAIALLWQWLYNSDFGIINEALRALGVRNPPVWLSDPRWAMPALIFMSVWRQAGYNMVIFLAGLQGIPQHLYEAAEIDGANRWQRFWRITLPMLSPTTFFVLVISVIGSFQVFDQALILTNGGPADATHTVVMYIYNQGFQFFKMGYAAAVAWILFMLIFVLTLAQWRYQSRWVHYE